MSDESKPQITFEQFAALDLRAAKVLEAMKGPNGPK